MAKLQFWRTWVQLRSLLFIGGEPIPAEHALGADGQIVAIGRNELEEIFEVIVPDVGVDEFFAGAIHDADVHLAGMEINSAVELCGGGVILHSDHSLMGSRDPGVYVWLCGEVLRHFLALNPMLSKTPKGLEGSINSPEPPPIGAFGSAFAVDSHVRRGSAFVVRPHLCAMTITYRIGFRDRLAFAAYHLTRNPLILLMSAAMFFMVTFLKVVPVMRESSVNTPPLVRVFVFVFIESLLVASILVFWTVMTVITMISRKNKPLYCERTLTIGDAGFITESEYGRSEIKWSLVQKLVRTRNHIIMYLNQQSAIMIPRRSFESMTQWDTFYEICRRNKKNVV